MTETAGQQLLNARLARGETLDQASEATHVRPRYLQALEMNDWAALPSVVQGKGFLRLYAGYLGLDPLPVLALVATQLAPAPALPAENNLPANVQPAPEVRILPAEPQRETAPETAALEGEFPAAADPVPPAVASGIQTAPASALSGQSSKQIFIDLGQDLQRQRELLSLSLAEVEKHTHLRTFTLMALEEGRMEDMPSMVQARGMLANYARFLNLDGEALLLRFAEALQARRAELAAGEISQKQQKPPRRAASRVVTNLPLKRFLSVDLVATGGLIVLLVLFVIWGAGHVLTFSAEQGVSPTAPSVSDVLMGSPQPTTHGPVVLPAATLTPTPPAGAALTTSVPTSNAPTVQISQAAGVGNTIEINLVASQRAWVKVTVDSKVLFTGRLAPGNAYPFSGAKQVEVLTGNAAGFQVYFNNNDLGVPGQEGEVLNLVFSAKGMTSQTPVVPTSPTTLTPVKTGTPKPSLSATPAPQTPVQ